MDLKERANVLIQSAELAQKNGALTLDEAFIAKQAIDVIKDGSDVKTGMKALVNIATIAQKKGVYSLQDSYYIFLAANDLDSCFVTDQTKKTKKSEK